MSEEEIETFINQTFTSQETYKKNNKYYKSLVHDEKGIEIILNGILTTLNSNFPPMSKLLAMRFLKEVMDGKKPLFIEAVGEYVVPYLKTIASFRPDLKDDNRGKLLFGDSAPADAQNIGNSILRLTLEFLLAWSFLYGKKYSVAVKELRELDAKFPESSGYFKTINWQEVLESAVKLAPSKSEPQKGASINKKPFKKNDIVEIDEEVKVQPQQEINKSKLKESIIENNSENKSKVKEIEVLNVNIIESPNLKNKPIEKIENVSENKIGFDSGKNLIEARKEFLKVLIDSKKKDMDDLVTKYLSHVEDQFVWQQYEKYNSKAITIKEFVLNIKATIDQNIPLKNQEEDKLKLMSNPIRDRLKSEYNRDLNEQIPIEKEKEKPLNSSQLNSSIPKNKELSKLSQNFLTLFKAFDGDINKVLMGFLVENKKKEILEYFGILAQINEIPAQDLKEETCKELIKSSELLVNHISIISKIMDKEILQPLTFNINANSFNSDFRPLYTLIKKLCYSIPFDYEDNPSVFYKASKDLGIKKFKFNIDKEMIKAIFDKIEHEFRSLEISIQNKENFKKILNNLTILKDISTEIIVLEPDSTNEFTSFITKISKLELLTDQEVIKLFKEGDNSKISFASVFESKDHSTTKLSISRPKFGKQNDQIIQESIYKVKKPIDEIDEEIFWKQEEEKPNTELLELQRKYENLTGEYQKLKNLSSKLQEQKIQIEKENFGLKGRVTSLENENFDIQQDLDLTRVEIMSLREEIEELKRIIEDLKNLKPAAENICNYTLSDDEDIYEGYDLIEGHKPTKIFKLSDNTLNEEINKDKAAEMLRISEFTPAKPSRNKIEITDGITNLESKLKAKTLKGKGYLIHNENLDFAFKLISKGESIIISFGILSKLNLKKFTVVYKFQNPNKNINLKVKPIIKNISLQAGVKTTQKIKIDILSDKGISNDIIIDLAINGM